MLRVLGRVVAPVLIVLLVAATAVASPAPAAAAEQQPSTVTGVMAPPPTFAEASEYCAVLVDAATPTVTARHACAPRGETFVLDGVAAGTYLLKVCMSSGGSVPDCATASEVFAASADRTLAVAAGVTVPVTLAWGGTMRVRVTAQNGDPVPTGCLRVSMYWSAKDCEPEDGVFELVFPRDAPFSWTPSFSLDGAGIVADASFSGEPALVRGGVTIEQAYSRPLLGASTLAVTVRGDDGTVPTRACVRATVVRFANGVAGDQSSSSCHVAEGGVVTIGGLPAGEFRVGASAASADTPSGPVYLGSLPSAVEVAVDGSTGAATLVELPSRQTVAGAVVGVAGEPVEGARVAIVALGTGAASGTTSVLAEGVTGSDGEYALTTPVVDGRLVVTGPVGYDTRVHPAATRLTDGMLVTGAWRGAGSTGLVTMLGSPASIVGDFAAPDTVLGDDLCVLAMDRDHDVVWASDCGQRGTRFEVTGLPDGGAFRLCAAAAAEPPACGPAGKVGYYSPPADGVTVVSRLITVASATDTEVSLRFGGTLAVDVSYMSPFEDSELAPGTCLELRDSYDNTSTVAEDCDPEGRTFTLEAQRDVLSARLVVRTPTGKLESVYPQDQFVLSGGVQSVARAITFSTEQVRGTIVLPAEIADADACVELFGEDGVPRSVCVAPGEEFAFDVPRARYSIHAWSPDGRFPDVWYADGEPVWTDDGGVRVDVPVAVPAATVTGRVLGPDGASAPGGCVAGFTPDLDSSWSTCVDESGAFTLPLGASGDVLLLFEGFDGLPDQWLGGAPTEDGAEPLDARPGATTSLEARLVAGGGLSGTVTGAPGTAEGDAWASAYTVAGAWVADTEVAADGTYEFPMLVPADYRVRFESADEAFPGGWARPSGSLVPRTVTVASGATVTGVDRTFAAASGVASVAGRLNVPASFGAPTVCAIAVASSGEALAADCGPRGAEFDLEPVTADGTARVAFTDGPVTTAADWAAFTGEVRWYGNVSAAKAPGVAAAGTVTERVPVWFFADVTTSVEAWRSVQWMADAGISRGYSDGTYRPFASTTRDALAAFMYRAAGSPAIDEAAREPFVDVSSDRSSPRYNEHWRAIAWMAQSGMSSGWQTSAGREYRPTARVTRDAMAAFLYRAEGSPGVEWWEPFMDVSWRTGSPLYSEHWRAISWMAETGLSQGWAVTGGREYRPTAALTRDAIAVFLDKWTALDG